MCAFEGCGLWRMVIVSKAILVFGVMTLLQEQRDGRPGIPDNAFDLLTDMQKAALRRIENFGWKLKFIRQPSFEPPLVVVENSTGINIGVLEEDGGVNLSPRIVLRD